MVKASKSLHHINPLKALGYAVVSCLGIADTALTIKYGFRLDLLQATALGTAICAILFLVLRDSMSPPYLKRSSKWLFGSNAVILAAALCFIGFFSHVETIFGIADWILPENTAPLIEALIYTLQLFAAFMALLAIRGVRQGKSECFITAIHAIALYLYLAGFSSILKLLDDFSLYEARISEINLIYPAISALAILWTAWASIKPSLRASRA